MKSITSKVNSFFFASLLLVAGVINAATIEVVSSGAFYATMEKLKPVFEEKSGHKVNLHSGSSMGASPTAIPNRLKRGETFDLIMLASGQLDKMIADGFAVKGSRVDLVHSSIGMTVRKGQPKPDISTKAKFDKVLLDAKSIGYSASASGTHLAKDVFPRVGVNEYHHIMGKSKLIVGDRVATWVGRGDLEIGFQQISEIVPFAGKNGTVDLVGPIPAPYQKVTIFSAGVAKGSKEPAAAQELVKFLTSKEIYPLIIEEGLQPAALATAGNGKKK
ncbi:molybdate transport system substrate-binding protein [Formivibrio citricus]|uniref:Molybdate transport system substrate-binding protein n=1 Tax=Formivibrio citricus TaxID=83765 RepID=A0A1I4V894_9NEIS|nr:substrate-binding domain-containing protein [Formivibrio citricus]SFM97384.1 molybdate transport system substrate-binding protein [Formivibrio citricus]